MYFSYMQLFMILLIKKMGHKAPFLHCYLHYVAAELATLPAAISPVFLSRTGM